MPFLKIEATTELSGPTKESVIEKSRSLIHEVKGDPTSLISVFVEGGVTGVFGTSTSPAANVHLESFDLSPKVTRKLTRGLSQILTSELGISPDNAYLFFYNVEAPHLTSWSGETFAEILTPHPGGRIELPRRLRGRLVNIDKSRSSHEALPLAGLAIELWKKGPSTCGYSFENRASADDNGYFELYFSADEATSENTPTVYQLRIFEPDQLVIINGSPGSRRFVAAVHPLRDTGLMDDIPLGQVAIDFYRYDASFPFPYAVPSSIRQGFSDRQEEAFKKSEKLATDAGQYLFASLDSSPNGLTIEDIQKRFGDAPTVRMERNNPGSSRSDEFFAERILNNMAPALFRIDSTERLTENDDPHIYVLDYNWRGFERRPDLTLLSFRARFSNRDGSLYPLDILIGTENEDDPERFDRFGPSDGERWRYAKRLVRAHYNNLVGQVHFHLAQTHFNMEQYGIAFLRNVFNHPIRQLIYPFIREILAINEKGRNTLLGGPSIVYEIEPISRKSVSDWVVNALGNADWRGFSPRMPINEGHDYAHSANLYWNVLSDFVDDFFERKRGKLAEHWSEIQRFSNDLVSNSLPYAGRPLESSPDPGQWYCNREISSPGREGLHSLSHITRSSAPTDGCIENLKQLAKYVIYYTTFVHSWTHENMLLDLGELRYSGHVRNGGLGPEKDDQFIAPIREATLALGSTHTLGRMDCGTMFKNEDGDVPADLIDRLKQQEGQFKSHGFDVDRLCARLNT